MVSGWMEEFVVHSVKNFKYFVYVKVDLDLGIVVIKDKINFHVRIPWDKITYVLKKTKLSLYFKQHKLLQFGLYF